MSARLSLSKAPGQQWSGVFVCLIFCGLFSAASWAQSGQCMASGPLQWAKIKTIVDGDTLHLTDGRKLRVIAVNAPELKYFSKRESRPAQPLAEQSRAAVKTFFAQAGERSKVVGLQLGVDSHDRYGRQLAHVFRADGESLAAHLLAEGLAWQVVVPPNDRYWRCLAGVESEARERRSGLWGGDRYPLKSTAELGLKDVGFQHLRGRVQSVSRSSRGWWLQMGKLAVYLSDKDLAYFEGISPERWYGKELTVRGWVIDRSRSGAVKSGFSALMLHLRHPAMLK
ncbi:MAG: thermonuclease family protein [Spongiibacteraceae bacterium]